MAISPCKNKNGKIVSYRAVLYSGKKKRAQKNFKRKIDAKRWLDEQQYKMELGYDNGNIPFSKACEEWLEFHSKPKSSPGSYKLACHMVNKVFLPAFGNKKLDQITTRDIEHFRAEFRHGRKNSTVNRNLQTLKCILNYFLKKNCLQKNVVSIVGPLPEETPEAKFLGLKQAKTLLNHVNQKYHGDKRWVYVFYLMALNTGMRMGEILGLKWDCVDLAGRRLVIRRSYCPNTKQLRETTKSRKIRHLGINSSLLPELERLWQSRLSDDSYVFHTPSGKVLNSKNFKRDYYSKDLEETNLPWIKIHELRHTFASHFAMRGGNLYDLQKLLGHGSIRTTERYSHLMPEHVIHQTEKIAIDGDENVIDISSRFQKREGR